MKSLIIASLLFLTAFSGTGHAMGWMFSSDAKKMNDCLAKASDAAKLPAIPGSLSGGYDSVKLDAGYCQCYTTITKDPVMMDRYCK